MPQHLVIKNYLRTQDDPRDLQPDYRYEVTTSGRVLSTDESKAAGLVTQAELERYADTTFRAAWIEVKAGETITIEYKDEEGHWKKVYTIPERPLTMPPISLSDPRSRGYLHKYLEVECAVTDMSHEMRKRRVA